MPASTAFITAWLSRCRSLASARIAACWSGRRAVVCSSALSLTWSWGDIVLLLAGVGEAARRGLLCASLRRGAELGLLGRFLHGRGRGLTAGDRQRDGVEIASAHLALVLGGGVAVGFRSELGLLQLAIGSHLSLAIAAGQFEHP